MDRLPQAGSEENHASHHTDQKIEPEMLYLPELRPLVGREVEITIREASAAKPSPAPAKSPNPLAGSVLEYDDPFGPAVPPEEWEANR